MNQIDRKLTKLSDQKEKLHEQMAQHDQSDYTVLAEFSTKLQQLDDEVEELETRWMELSEIVD